MPEVVAKWVETHNFEKVEKLQDNILLDYSSDFAKHTPKADSPQSLINIERIRFQKALVFSGKTSAFFCKNLEIRKGKTEGSLKV